MDFFSGMPTALMAFIAYSAASAGPLSSLVPRAKIWSPTRVAVNGGVAQLSPAGTTSRCPSTAMASSDSPGRVISHA